MFPSPTPGKLETNCVLYVLADIKYLASFYDQKGVFPMAGQRPICLAVILF